MPRRTSVVEELAARGRTGAVRRGLRRETEGGSGGGVAAGMGMEVGKG